MTYVPAGPAVTAEANFNMKVPQTDTHDWVFICLMTRFVVDEDIFTLSPGDVVTFPNGQSAAYDGPGIYHQGAELANTPAANYVPGGPNAWLGVDSDDTTALFVQ